MPVPRRPQPDPYALLGVAADASRADVEPGPGEPPGDLADLVRRFRGHRAGWPW